MSRSRSIDLAASNGLDGVPNLVPPSLGDYGGKGGGEYVTAVSVLDSIDEG
jgi:hypothetical protein